MNKVYDIFLDQNKIGTTELEKSDASMGVVFGKIDFLKISSGYSFFKDYCLKNKIGFNDFPEESLISTRAMPKLQVVDESSNEIKGLASSVSGMDSDCFEISIEGIPYPFYEDEFPHHIKVYKDTHDI